MLETRALVLHHVGTGSPSGGSHGDTDSGFDECRGRRSEPWFGSHQIDESSLSGQTATNQRTHDRVCLPERDPVSHEMFGQIGRGHRRRIGGLLHAVVPECGRGDHAVDGGEAERHLLDGVEERLFVRPALPRANSAMSAFFFCGSIDEPVA